MSESGQTARMTCDEFNAMLGDFLEGGLAEHEQQLAEAHVASCAACTALVSELDDIVQAAGALPAIAPPRDLWPAINSRLEAPVLALPVRDLSVRQPRSASWRTLAAAAALLVTASAGITWTLARNTGTTVEVPALASGDTMEADSSTEPAAVAVVDSQDRIAGLATDAPAADQITLREPPLVAPLVASQDAGSNAAGTTSRAAVPSNLPRNSGAAQLTVVANPERMMALDTLYGREIATLRTVAESQLDKLGLLDSATVNVVRRNLDIIDRAILESRTALAGDPNSAFLLEQLDRAYERKVDLLRRLVLM